MNLILPQEQELPTKERAFDKLFFDKNNNLDQKNYQQLYNIFKNKVSFLRKMEDNLDKEVKQIQIPMLQDQIKEYNKLLKQKEKVGNMHEYFRILTSSKGGQSNKFNYLLKKINDSPRQLFFVYLQYIGKEGGILQLKNFLIENGFHWITNMEQMNKKTDPYKRFALLSSSGQKGVFSGNGISHFLGRFNKEDNKYGKYCRIVIVTAAASTGYTFKNIRQAHILNLHWNFSKLRQIEGRVHRLGSHKMLPEKERKLEVYRYISTAKGKETWDQKMYKKASNKSKKTEKILRLIKELSWDCPLTYKRNVLISDVNNSIECNYENCNYECDGFPVKNIDKNEKVWNYNIEKNKIKYFNYHKNFAEKKVSETIQNIKKFFRKRFEVSFDELNSKVQKDSFVLTKSLYHIINAKIKIKNKYGFDCYLKEKNNIYFLDFESQRTDVDPIESIYVSTIFINSIRDLKNIVRETELDEDFKIVQKICKNPLQNINLFFKLNWETQILISEKFYYLKNLNLIESKYFQAIKGKYGKYFYEKNNKIYHILHRIHSQKFARSKNSQRVYFDTDIRVLENGKWRYVSNQNKQDKKDVSLLENKNEAFNKMVKIGEETGISGRKVDDTKFYLYIRKTEKTARKQRNRGKICSSFKINELKDIIKKFKIMPELEELLKLRSYKLYDGEKIDLKDTDKNKFDKFWEFIDQRKAPSGLKKFLCNTILNWLKKKKYFVDSE
jgi:hypothetical protein